ncbi:MAG: hypothetical protein RRY79_05550 [Clostridia bacterium]
MKQISIKESTINEAMAQIDALDGINPKNRSCLRLLTEEMFSMAMELLNKDSMDFSLKNENGQYDICVATKTKVSEKAREQFLSISSSGKNIANKGVKGLLGAVFELFSYDGSFDEYTEMIPYGVYSHGGEFSYMWMLSEYMDHVPEETLRTNWDGMEKSIIVNFSDDVAIGVRNGKLEMTVTKTFS